MTITLFARDGDAVPAACPPAPAGRRFLQDRRRFLATSLGAVGAYAVTSGGATWLVGAGRAWAAELEVFDAELAEGLLQVCRACYPHDFLGDVHYAKVVQDLDAEAAPLENPAGLLGDGMAALDEAAGGSFASASEAEREAALASMAETPFFQTIRGKTIVSLYTQPEVWAAFGYEGPSYEKGGYLFNGFDDLAWLPAPSAEASPPVQL